MICIIDDFTTRTKVVYEEIKKKHPCELIAKEKIYHEDVVLVLPIQGINQEGMINDFSLKNFLIMNKTKILAGKTNFLNAYTTDFTSYLAQEDFVNYNSYLTALGLLGIIITSSNCDLKKARTLILGYGNSAKAIAKMFEPFTNIAIYSRKIQTDYLREESLDNISQYDVIVNTIPTLILDESILEKVCGRIYDIASAPGGIDYDYAKKNNVFASLELAIPNRFFSKAAGELIANTCMKIMNPS